MRDLYIYKVLTPAQWASFQSTGGFTGSPVDVSDGYIHMSCAPQLLETMDKYYADVMDAAILEIDSRTVAANLKYEVSRGGAEFPHLFADLPLAAVGRIWIVSPESGRFTLPQDIKAER